MRILSATVRNYRVLTDCHVTFDPSRTVIGAPNESGKSTLAEAIHQGFFLRSRITGAIQKSMLSELAAGPPTVEIRFEAGGCIFELQKVFSGNPSASTTLREVSLQQSDASGKRMLRNDSAEARIHELLGVEDIGGGRNVESRIRIQWGHVWVWQGAATDNPLVHANSDRQSELLRTRLARLDGGGVLESSSDAAAADDVFQRQAATFTDKGKPRSGSALDAATAAVADAATANERVRALVTALDDAVMTIDIAEKTIAACEATILQARSELEQVRVRQQEAALLAVRVAEEKAVVIAADAAFADVLRVDVEIASCIREIESLEHRLGPDLRTLADLEREEREWAKRSTEATEEMLLAGQRHAAASAVFALHDAVEKYLRLLLEREGLGGRCARIAAQRERSIELEAHLARIPVVSEDILAELTSLDHARESAEAALEATATRIELMAATLQVTLGGEELECRIPTTITSPAELILGDAATLRITPGGGRSLADATNTLLELRSAIGVRLSSLGLESIDAAREAFARRQMVAGDLRATELAIDGLGGDSAEADLRVLDAEIAKAAAVVTSRPSDGLPRADSLPATREALAAAERALAEAVAAMAATSTALAASKLRLQSVAEKRLKAADGLVAAKAEFAAIQTRIAVLEERYGPERKRLLESLAAEHTRAVEKLDASRALLRRLSPDALELDRQRLERGIANVSAERQDADTRRHIARSRLELEGTTDPREDLARADAHLRLTTAELVLAKREAAAILMLADLFTEMKREVEARYVAPLAARVSGYLDSLYGEGTTAGVTYEAGQFTGLSLTRRGVGAVTFPFGQLSAGAREQVAAAFRLGMAEVLAADHDGTLPVVFDDSFVNSDADRQRALQRLLDLGSSRGLQLIVLTCRPEAYAMFGAATVTLPPNPFVA